MTEQKLDAAAGLAAVLNDGGYVLGDIATKLTCTEANALAEFVAAWITPEFAQEFLAAHAEGDDEGDLHYVGEDGEVHERS